MNGVRGLVGAAAIYSAANAISAAFPFLMMPVLTRTLSTSDYGIYSMFGTTVTVLAVLTGLGAYGAINVRYFDRDGIDLPAYIGTCLAILATSAVTVLALVAIGGPWLSEITKVPSGWLLIAVAVAAAQSVIQNRLVLWQAGKQPLKYGALQVGQSALNAAVALALVLGFGWNWQGAASGQAVATLSFLLVAIASLASTGWIKCSIRRDYAADALRFCLPLLPHAVGGMIIVVVDRFMVSNLLDVGKVGIYTVALQLSATLGILTSSFNRAYSTWLFENLKRNQADANRRVVRYTYLYFFAVTLSAVVLGAMSPILLRFLAGEEFRGAAELVPHIAMGFAFGGMYYMVVNQVFFVRRTGSLAMVTCLVGGISIVVTYVLIEANGLRGAGQGFMISQALLFLGTWWLSHQVCPMPWMRALLPA